MMLAAYAEPAADPALEAARAARLAGRSAEAIAALEQLSRSRPGDADIWLNLGLSYASAGQEAAAEGALETALRLAPTYGDVHVSYARLALQRGDLALARTRLAPALAQGAPEARALQAQIEAADRARPHAWRLDVAASQSELSDDLGRWTSVSLSLGRRFATGAASLSVEQTERFGRRDVYVEALALRSMSEGGETWLAVGGTPDADYRPEAAVRAGGSLVIARSGTMVVRLGLDASWARYQVGDVRSVQPHVTLAWGEGASLTLRAYNTLDENEDYLGGYAVQGAVAVSPTLRLHAGWADAPESADGRTVKVQAISGGAAWDLDGATTLRATATHEERGAYDRDEIALAVTRRF